jgi:HEAT repeat protein
MRKPIIFLIVFGVLAIGIAWLFVHRMNKEEFREIFSSEPKYEGRTFTYWMEHWYLNPWGSPVNPESQAALKAMGVRAVPYLVKWVEEPPKYGLELNRPEYALQGFQVLGPTAKSAIPDLLKNIDQNQGYPARALQCIGKDAVPALAEKLLETLADKREPIMNWRDPGYKGNFFHVQVAVIRCLQEMGTNAEAAIPALVKAMQANHRWWWTDNPYAALVSVGKNHPEIIVPALTDVLTNSSVPEYNRGVIAEAMSSYGTNHIEAFLPVLMDTINNKHTDAWSRRVMAGALAIVGQNQPDLVVPVLIEAFTNTDDENRYGIAEALGGFGSNARVALPLLLPDIHSSNFYLREKAAIAVKEIAPEQSDAMAVLIQDLNNPQPGNRQQTIYALGRLGTNGLDAVPALLQCLSHPDMQTRIDATRSLTQIGVTSDEFIADLGENLSCTNEFMVQEAEETLCNLAGRSKLAFVTLVKNGVCGQIGKSYQDQAKFLLANTARTNSASLLACLDDTNAQVRYGALKIFNEFRTPTLRPHFVPEAIPKLMELSTNDPDQNVRRRAADALRWQTQ